MMTACPPVIAAFLVCLASTARPVQFGPCIFASDFAAAGGGFKLGAALGHLVRQTRGTPWLRRRAECRVR